MSMVIKLPRYDFAVVHNPVAATQATITQAAPTAQTMPAGNAFTTQIVVDAITVSSASAGTAQTPIHAYLRDGATGAGTIVWSGTLAHPANSGEAITMSCLRALCRSGNATLEFEAAGVAASVQSVSMAGYFEGYGSN